MKFLYALVSWGIVALGVIHMLATLHFFKTLTSAALWFFSGGIAMALTWALNLLHRAYGEIAPGLRRVCIGTNIVMTAFGIVAGVVGRAGIAQFALVLGLIGGAAALSLNRSAITQRANSGGKNTYLTGLLILIALPAGDSVVQAQTYDQLVHLYEYDRSAPLAVEQKETADRNGTKVYSISYAISKETRASGMLIVPPGKAPRSGLIWLHSAGPLSWLSDALLMSQAGAVSLIVDPPGASPDASAEQYRGAMVKAIISIRRAVDLLESRPDVDPKRIGYVGHSYGAMMGAVAVAVDKRFKAAVFEVGLSGMSYHIRNSSHPVMAAGRQRLGARLETFLKVIAPIDAVHYIGHASPATLLFQSARFDPGVSEQESLDFFNAASEPKQLKWYDTPHDVADITAISDRARFLARELKLDSIDSILRRKIGLK